MNTTKLKKIKKLVKHLGRTLHTDGVSGAAPVRGLPRRREASHVASDAVQYNRNDALLVENISLRFLYFTHRPCCLVQQGALRQREGGAFDSLVQRGVSSNCSSSSLLVA